MKKFYYFSKNKLKFVEIRNFQKKFIFLTLFFSFLFSFAIFGSYWIIEELINPNRQVKSLLAENRELKSKLKDFENSFSQFEEQLTQLSEINNELRLATNLEPITKEDREIGIGGKIFKEITPSTSEDVSSLINVLNSYVDRIKVKLSLEKDNYDEIEKTLEYNSKLYDALPAIKPTTGRYGDKFGIRFHPILKIRRMHYGQDIITNRGTPVYSPGMGKIEFVGRKGGHGNTIIIDHGFGYKTLYSHLSKFKVKKGQRVKRGELIALTGSSGKLATGPHLHYEVTHNGIALDPRNFIYEDVNIFEINPDAKPLEE